MTFAKILGLIMLITAAVGYRIALAEYCRKQRRQVKRNIVTRYRARLRRANFRVWRMSVENFSAEERRRIAERRGIIYVKHPAMMEPLKTAIERRGDNARTKTA